MVLEKLIELNKTIKECKEIIEETKKERQKYYLAFYDYLVANTQTYWTADSYIHVYTLNEVDIHKIIQEFGFNSPPKWVRNYKLFEVDFVTSYDGKYFYLFSAYTEGKEYHDLMEFIKRNDILKDPYR